VDGKEVPVCRFPPKHSFSKKNLGTGIDFFFFLSNQPLLFSFYFLKILSWLVGRGQRRRKSHGQLPFHKRERKDVPEVAQEREDFIHQPPFDFS
jgi:hypothetical protein